MNSIFVVFLVVSLSMLTVTQVHGQLLLHLQVLGLLIETLEQTVVLMVMLEDVVQHSLSGLVAVDTLDLLKVDNVGEITVTAV